MKNTNQTISRKNLQKIYNSDICNDWKKKVAELALFESGDEIQVKNELIQQAFKAANEDQQKMIKVYFDLVSDSIFDRIKTVGDAYKERQLHMPEFVLTKSKRHLSLQAIEQLQVVIEALNGDWSANFKDQNQKKYYLWFEYRAVGG